MSKPYKHFMFPPQYALDTTIKYPILYIISKVGAKWLLYGEQNGSPSCVPEYHKTKKDAIAAMRRIGYSNTWDNSPRMGPQSPPPVIAIPYAR